MIKNSLKIVGFVLAVGLIGCDDPAETSTSQQEPAEATGGGGHQHAHGDVGPNGGHLLHLEPSGAHAEWTHDDDTHLITVYLSDFDQEKLSGVKFVATIDDQVENFDLEAGEDNSWSISSESLMTYINMGDSVAVQLVVTDDTGEQATKIEAHEHHHH